LVSLIFSFRVWLAGTVTLPRPTTIAFFFFGLSFRPLLATASAKPKKKKAIVVGRGKVTVPANQTRKLKMRLTKVGLAVLEQVGKLKMVATVTTTAAGLAPVVETHTVTVVAKPAKPSKHGHKH